MKALPQPLGFLVLLFCGWVNRSQQAAIEYLLEESRVLREARKGRLRLTDDPGDWRDDAERTALHKALLASDADVAAGRLVDSDEAVRILRSR